MNPDLPARPAWMALARCSTEHRGDRPNVWLMPGAGESKYERHRRERLAAAECALCPVQEHCFVWACRNGDMDSGNVYARHTGYRGGAPKAVRAA